MLRDSDFFKDLNKAFPFTPTADQSVLMRKWTEYLFGHRGKETFILRGYAGTGKTTCIRSLVKVLPRYQRKAILLAPTGRAAKVMQNYTGKQAFTIHRFIYRPQRTKSGEAVFRLRENKATNAVFIVDEASMIPDTSLDNKAFGDRSLLEDLLYFVAQGVGCKLILIGDVAQLPPVGLDLSPALDPAFLAQRFDRIVHLHELTQVMRQASESVLLEDATQIREIQGTDPPQTPKLDTGPDVVRLVDGYDIQDALQTAFTGEDKDDTIFIVRSNKRANLYNQAIRSRIMWNENEIATGDRIMVVKNNYYWLDEKSKAGFLANGEILEILGLTNHKELYGFRFVDAQLRLVDYPDEPTFEAKLLLDTLSVEAPSLPYERQRQLYQEVVQDYAELPKYKQYQKVKENPYFNALQVKFAYAVTCHKAQGGQWKQVFIEQSWIPDGVDREYLRWLYTALTRAREKAYLIGFTDDFFSEDVAFP